MDRCTSSPSSQSPRWSIEHQESSKVKERTERERERQRETERERERDRERERERERERQRQRERMHQRQRERECIRDKGRPDSHRLPRSAVEGIIFFLR